MLWLGMRHAILMNSTRLASIFGVIGLALVILALGQEEASPPSEVKGDSLASEIAPELQEVSAGPEQVLKEARKLVARLGDDSFKVREAATQNLWDLGDVGIDAIREGVEADDPEVSYRSRIVLRRIMTGITSETPPEIVELVQRYFRSGPEVKKAIFQELLNAEAYMQMLRLYRFEESEEARQVCGELVEKAVLPLTLRELVEGRREEAEAILRLAPRGEENNRRLACLLRMNRDLDHEIAKGDGSIALGDDGMVTEATREAAEIQLALLRSAGRLVDSRALAEKLGRSDVVAVMALLEGDPEPYLEWCMNRPRESAIVRVHAETVLRRWQLDHEESDRLMEQMANEASGDGEDEEKRGAVLSLLLNGNVDVGLPLLFRMNKDSAFTYYDTVEQPGKALQVFGYTGGEEDRRKWLGERFEAMATDWSDSEEERYEVLTIASFLHTRGEQKESIKIMERLSELALKDGFSNWLEFVGRLNDLGGSLYELAFLVSSKRLTADSKERDDLRVVAHLFGEGDSAPRLWGFLERVEEEKAKRILLLGALYGIVHMDDAKLRAALKILEAKASEEEEQQQILGDLLEAAEARDEATVSVGLLEKLAKNDPEMKWGKKLAAKYGQVSEWGKAVSKLREVIEKEPTNMRYLAYYGGALARTGNDGDARESLDKVETFSLDEPIRLLRMALDVNSSGAVAKAEDYWRKLVITGGPADWYWQTAASYFSKQARNNKQWRVAAAFAEVDAMQYLKGRSTFINPVSFIRKRFIADLYRGLALHEEGNQEEANKLFRSSFEILNGDGILADDYFPLLREAGLIEEHDRNFRIVYGRLAKSIEAYPKAHNTYNSAAWMASRACRELPDAMQKIERALAMRPRQAAYLDTMAEVWFAKQDRSKAVEWSRKAVRDSFHGGSGSEAGVGLREQYDRFISGEFPVP